MSRPLLLASLAIAGLLSFTHLATAQVLDPAAAPERTLQLSPPGNPETGSSPEMLAPIYTPNEELNGTSESQEASSTADENQDGEAKQGDTEKKKEEQEKKKKEEEKKTAEKKKKEKEKKAKLKKAAASAFKPMFYDNAFSYLSDPNYDGYFLGEGIKQIKCLEYCGCSAGECTVDSPCTSCTQGGVCKWLPLITLDLGGQYRYRYHHEENMRGLGLTGVDDDFFLQRTRLFGNLRFGKRIRFFAEYIDAVSQFEDFRPRPIEENRSDMLNLFLDGTLLDFGERKLKGRIGRQEFLYGAQRAVSPLDWANTRRTFDGAKIMWQGKHFDVDGFWARPLRISDRHFDSPNLDQQFYGVYSSYKGFDKDKLESYWLAFDNDATGFRVDSIGGRWYGEDGNLLVELWGNYQFGTNTDGSSHAAGAFTVGIGHKSDCGWKPTWWVYYDWASGDGNAPGAGNGYFQFFPLAHKYLGFMDFYGRRNIETPNVQFSVQPTKKLKLLAWYYYFFLEDARDTPYSVAMTPFAPGVTPNSADLGQELDLIAAYKLSPRTGMLLGYSHFFSGAYYDTPGLPYSGDANFFYVQYHVNF
jgi:hypothetical protein